MKQRARGERLFLAGAAARLDDPPRTASLFGLKHLNIKYFDSGAMQRDIRGGSAHQCPWVTRSDSGVRLLPVFCPKSNIHKPEKVSFFWAGSGRRDGRSYAHGGRELGTPEPRPSSR